MQIVFNTFNHNEIGRRSLEDVIAIMGHQLNALGHKVVYRHQNDSFVTHDSGYNFVIEGFTPSVVGVLKAAHGLGARFICVATEEPTPKGFNFGTQREMVWRQEVFPEAAKYFDGILHLVPGKHVTDWYGQHAPTAQAELGFAPTLYRPDPAIVPDFEFGFYGSLTKRRKAILKKLANMTPQYKAVKLMVNFGTQADRDREMQRAKVIVQIRKFDEMGLVSSSRCNTIITLGRAVVAEPHDLVKPWDQVISFPDTMEQFYASCMWAAARWKDKAREQLMKLAEKLSPEFCVGRPFEQILAANVENKRAA